MIARLKNLFKRKEPEPRIQIVHPKDVNIRPVKSEYVLQYRVRKGHWEEVDTSDKRLPNAPLRLWRHDTYRVGEGFRGNTGMVVPNGTYTSYEYLGLVDADTFNMHNGQFTPEFLNQDDKPARNDQKNKSKFEASAA